MANWEEIRVTAKTVANRAMQKTGELADLAAMRIRLKALESRRDELYRKLGQLTYRQLKTGDSQAERIAPVVEKLDVVRAKIRAQIAEIEEERGARAAEKEKVYVEDVCEEKNTKQ